MDKIRSYLNRYKSAKSESDEWMSTIQNAYKYAIPQQVTYYDQDTGQQEGYDIYDSTLADALNVFSGRMVSRMIPQGTQWIKLVSGPDVPEQEKTNIERELSNKTELFFRYVDRSNFYSTMPGAFKDWAIGTMVLVCNETDDLDDPMVFSAVPIDQVYLEKSSTGVIKTVFRRHENFIAREIEEQWFRSKVDEEISYRINNDVNYKINLIEANVWDFKKKKNNYVVMSEDGEHVFLDETSDSSPFLVVRQGIYRNNAFGRGIVLDLMPDVKSASKMRENMLKAEELALSPPILSFTNSIFNANNLRIAPGAMIPVEPLPNGNASLQPMNFAQNFNPVMEELNFIRSRIERALFTQPIGPYDSKTKTATEIEARIREMIENLSPAVNIFAYEFNNQFVDRVLYILNKKGLMSPIGADGSTPVKADGRIASIKFDSPLSVSQNLSDLLSLEQFHAQMVQMFGEDAASTFYETEEMPMYVAEKRGVDPNIIKSPEELRSIAQAMFAAQNPEVNPMSSLVSQESLPTGQIQSGVGI